jgi:hypothetical protein
MVNLAQVQKHVNRGLGKAATKLGENYSWYRAASAAYPIASGNLLGTIEAQFASDPGFMFKKPSQYSKASWYGMFDPTNVLSGDYFVGTLGTFFVTDVERIAPPQCIYCNRVITVNRPQQQTTTGLNGYGGDVLAGETAIMTQWPASILMTRRGTGGETKLPGDTRNPWNLVLLPHFSGVDILSRDLIADDLGNRYVVSVAELTLLGWRIEAQQVMA